MINETRLKDLLLDLCSTASESRSEYQVAMKLKAAMEASGAQVEIDGAGEFAGGNVGNVICKIPANVPDAPPIFLAAHMDTVKPGIGVQPIVDGFIIRSDGTTVLGGDDKSGCAIIVEVCRIVQEQNLPHGDIEAVFTICEEVGLLGAKFLDLTKIKSKYGLVLDSDDPGFLFTQAPASTHMEWTIHGLEAHAAMAPEQGISAIQVASEGIAKMKLGRIDHETVANLGTIQGGIAMNVVPNKVVVRGEARSMNMEKLDAQIQHMTDCLTTAAAQHQVEVNGLHSTARVETQLDRQYGTMDVAPDSPLVALVMEAANNLQLAVQPMLMMGGCDANVLNQKGLLCANLGSGMRNIHTVKEWLDVRDMYRSARVVLEIVRLNGLQKASVV